MDKYGIILFFATIFLTTPILNYSQHAENIIINNKKSLYSTEKLQLLTDTTEKKIKRPIEKPYWEAGSTFFTPGGVNLMIAYTKNKYGIRACGGYIGDTYGAQMEIIINRWNTPAFRSGAGIVLGYHEGWEIDISLPNRTIYNRDVRGYYLGGEYFWNIGIFYFSAGLGYIFYHPDINGRIMPLINLGFNHRILKNK